MQKNKIWCFLSIIIFLVTIISNPAINFTFGTKATLDKICPKSASDLIVQNQVNPNFYIAPIVNSISDSRVYMLDNKVYLIGVDNGLLYSHGSLIVKILDNSQTTLTTNTLSDQHFYNNSCYLDNNSIRGFVYTGQEFFIGLNTYYYHYISLTTSFLVTAPRIMHIGLNGTITNTAITLPDNYSINEMKITNDSHIYLLLQNLYDYSWKLMRININDLSYNMKEMNAFTNGNLNDSIFYNFSIIDPDTLLLCGNSSISIINYTSMQVINQIKQSSIRISQYSNTLLSSQNYSEVIADSCIDSNQKIYILGQLTPIKYLIQSFYTNLTQINVFERDPLPDNFTMAVNKFQLTSDGYLMIASTCTNFNDSFINSSITSYNYTVLIDKYSLSSNQMSLSLEIAVESIFTVSDFVILANGDAFLTGQTDYLNTNEFGNTQVYLMQVPVVQLTPNPLNNSETQNLIYYGLIALTIIGVLGLIINAFIKKRQKEK